MTAQEFKEKIYATSLVSGEQVDDAKGEDDLGAYWLQDITVEELVEFLQQLNLINK
jgi:hypothetical protein